MFEKRVPVSTPTLSEIRQPGRLSPDVVAEAQDLLDRAVQIVPIGDYEAVAIVNYVVDKIVNLPNEDREEFSPSAYMCYRLGGRIHDLGELGRVRRNSIREVTRLAVGLSWGQDLGSPSYYPGIHCDIPETPRSFLKNWAEFFTYSGLYAAHLRAAKPGQHSGLGMADLLARAIDEAFRDNPDFPYSN